MINSIGHRSMTNLLMYKPAQTPQLNSQSNSMNNSLGRIGVKITVKPSAISSRQTSVNPSSKSTPQYTREHSAGKQSERPYSQ